MSLILEPRTASAVGSLPHTDPVEAAAVALGLQPGLPAAPQLPRRHVLEGMVAQVAVGVPGVAVRPDGGLEVDVPVLAATPDATPLDAEAWAGTIAFLAMVAATGRTAPIKVQVCGPVTLARALASAGAPAEGAAEVAVATIRSRVAALVAAARATAPAASLVVVLDEPALVGEPGSSGLTSEVLASAASIATAGVHCCGPTDWTSVIDAGPDVVSLPVEAAATLDAGVARRFLDGGGWFAWGAVPTDRPSGDHAEPHARALGRLWHDLDQRGCDAELLWARSIFTPACGLALHPPSEIERIYRLVAGVAEHVRAGSVAGSVAAGA